MKKILFCSVRSSLIFSTLLAAFTVNATADSVSTPKNSNSKEAAIATKKNLKLIERGFRGAPPPWSPAPEVSNYRYMVITADHFAGDSTPKRTFAENLPEDIKLVVIARTAQGEQARREFSQWIDSKRLIVGTAPDIANGFWARDAFPFPVIRDDGSRNELVATRYYRPFSGGREIAKTIGAPLTQSDFTFVGGNIQADGDGRCFAIDGPRRYGANTELLKATYGCKEVEWLPHLAGIGDVDEVIKILPGKKILSNQPRYNDRLRALGYEVKPLIQAPGYRTYANSVILGSTVFMPAYDTQADEIAKATYEREGFRVVKVDSRTLSDQGRGSLHCISMAYPEMGISELMRLLGAELASSLEGARSR